MVAQCLPSVFGTECAPVLQQRHHPVDEFIQAARRQVWHKDETIAGVGLNV